MLSYSLNNLLLNDLTNLLLLINHLYKNMILTVLKGFINITKNLKKLVKSKVEFKTKF